MNALQLQRIQRQRIAQQGGIANASDRSYAATLGGLDLGILGLKQELNADTRSKLLESNLYSALQKTTRGIIANIADDSKA